MNGTKRVVEPTGTQFVEHRNKTHISHVPFKNSVTNHDWCALLGN